MINSKKLDQMSVVLATDVGSTTTKARLFKKIMKEWRYIASGEAPTTVETPYEDVTMGALNAIREIEELTGLSILSPDRKKIIVPRKDEVGVDLYCTTSSAGGGLQMMVAGVILTMTAESANRAALGAGAVVMDILAYNDGRDDFQRIENIRALRPDMILFAGGVDGGTVRHVLHIGEVLKAAQPKPRLGASYDLPIVFSGNKDAVKAVDELLGKEYAFTVVPNLRPQLDLENTGPAREAIHELFMEHVMSHAPGYGKLMKWTDVDIMPTPAGEGLAVQLIGKLFRQNVLGVGLGGATTNVYSVFNDKFVRSVSANLGMSYSICNVLKESGLQNIMRWLPFDVNENTVRNILGNKMIRPTTLPATLQELLIEHAVAREALRLGLQHHKTIATRLKGAKGDRVLSQHLFDQGLEDTYIKMMEIGVIVGTGGLLSHAPRRAQSLMILTDAWQPEGVTMILQDSVFMMPHLGVLSTVHEEAATQIFDKDCLVRVGTVIAPSGQIKEGEVAVEVRVKTDEGLIIEEAVGFSELKRIPLKEGHSAEAEIRPGRGLDVGQGNGRNVNITLYGGIVGVIIDARGRPLLLPEVEEERKSKLFQWIETMELYPSAAINKVKQK
jgi:uncharacterized protein (TIGR01319 family)